MSGCLRRLVFIAVAVGVVVVSAGCGSEESSPPLDSTAESSTAAPTDPTTTTLGDSDAVLSVEEMGPFKIGMTVAEAEIASPAPLDLTHFSPGSSCFEIDLDTPAGVWLRVQMPEGESDPAAGLISVIGLLDGSAESGAVTDTGIRVGDDLQELELVYGGSLEFTEVEYAPGSRLAIIGGGRDLAMVFILGADDVVGAIQAGRSPDVNLVEGCF